MPKESKDRFTLAALVDSDREGTLDALANISGRMSPSLRLGVQRCLAFADPAVRISAAEILTRPDIRSSATLRSVTILLDDPDPAVRLEVLLALSSETSEALTERMLCQRLADDDWIVRATAASVVGKIGSNTPGTIEAILRLLDDEEPIVRGDAYLSLAHLLGPQARQHLEPRLLHQKTRMEEPRLIGALALANRQLSNFIELLESKDDDVVFLSLQILYADFVETRFQESEWSMLIDTLDGLANDRQREDVAVEAERILTVLRTN